MLDIFPIQAPLNELTTTKNSLLIPDFCEEMQVEMVWVHNKINRTCKDDPTRHGTGRENERQIKKRWEDKISEWIGLRLGEAF